MKVMGFVVVVVGLVMVYVGITGSQHILMATLKGSNSPVASGSKLNPSGSGTGGSSSNSPLTGPPTTTLV